MEKNEKKNIISKKSSQEIKPGKQGKFYPADGVVLKASIYAAKKILALSSDIKRKYNNSTVVCERYVSIILKDLMPTNRLSYDLWAVANKWVTGSVVVPKSAPLLGSVLNALCSSKIVKADNSKKGTQLKLSLTLAGGHQALFKPQWYKRNEVISGPVYAGKDRHNAEVAGFHLSLLLGFRRVPLTVGRKIDLRREVMPVATQALRDTFFQEGNNTCFYGVCYYCSATDPVCANRNFIEGALILWLPSKLTFAKYGHPWQRSYSNNLVARWEVEENYCDRVKKAKIYDTSSRSRLLDLIDCAIFDFLLSNGDRHHYEIPVNSNPSSVFLFDNGKSFGDPEKDHIDILAPLYQCCIVRRRTWDTLLIFQGGALGNSLERLLRTSHIAPVLTDNHLKSLDRRLLLVYAAVELCFQDKGKSSVLL